MSYRRYRTYREAQEKPEPEFFVCRKGCNKRIVARKGRAVHEWYFHDGGVPVRRRS
ncbi:MAG: hypothetical protein IID41_06825 [Planctomycetes bacterium]|nr:hypothetical protein [Planctomycetota bacterium]